MNADHPPDSGPYAPRTHRNPRRDIVESYQLVVNTYIVKPVDFEQFAESVRQLGFYWALLNQPPSV